MSFGVGVGIGVAVAIGSRSFRITIANPDTRFRSRPREFAESRGLIAYSYFRSRFVVVGCLTICQKEDRMLAPKKDPLMLDRNALAREKGASGRLLLL